MFIDEIKVFAQAGHGGKGCVALHREAFVAKGGPSGGNGGRGGNVILEACHDLNNLIQQFYNPRLIAERGEGGMGKGMDGHAGKDLIIKVPCGTLVWRMPSDKKPEPPAEDTDGDEEEDGGETAEEKAAWKISTSLRPVIRTVSGARALELDLSGDDDEGSKPDPFDMDGTEAAPELVADLTRTASVLSFAKVGAADWETVISPPHAAKPRASPSPARKAKRVTTNLNYAFWRKSVWSVTLMPASQPFSPPYPRPAPKLRLTRSPLSIPKSALSNTRIGFA